MGVGMGRWKQSGTAGASQPEGCLASDPTPCYGVGLPIGTTQRTYHAMQTKLLKNTHLTGRFALAEL